MTLDLSQADADSAAKIQQALDSLPAAGGHVILPAITVTLDRGLELRSGVRLTGQGADTVLRKGPGHVYPLTGYHNYGMRDVPLHSTDGLEVGMTVSILDDVHRGFLETFARITWLDAGWVGLSNGLEMDYSAEQNPRLTTAHPLVFGHGVQDVYLADLVLDGQREEQRAAMGSCRGGAVYFYRSRDIEIADVVVRDYHGDGLSHQMCRDVVVRNSRFDTCSGNGMHPGAGSTNCRYLNCAAEGNDGCGYFFCVRATRITVENCRFTGNGTGVSIGTRDCHNLIDDCEIRDNAGPGIDLRPSSVPVEVQSCVIRNCKISGNAKTHGDGQIVVSGAAHDICISDCEFTGIHTLPLPGIYIGRGTERIACLRNTYRECVPVAGAQPIEEDLGIICGHDSGTPESFRHLR